MWRAVACKQVFVPAEGCGVEVAMSAGMCIASTDLLFAEDTVEQVGHQSHRLQSCMLHPDMQAVRLILCILHWYTCYFRLSWDLRVNYASFILLLEYEVLCHICKDCVPSVRTKLCVTWHYDNPALVPV